MPTPRRPLPDLPELAAPVPLAALAALALNDHLAKAAWPGVVTGKLSDVAGCFVLPLVVSALLALATRWPLALRLVAGAAATVVFFAALKLSQPVADAVARALGAAGALAGLPPGRIAADPTDLVALPFAGLAVLYGLRRGRRVPARVPHAAVRLAVVGGAVVLLSATSMAPHCPPEIGLSGAPLTYEAETDCGPRGQVVLHVERGDGQYPRCAATLEGAREAGLVGDPGDHGYAYGRTLHLFGGAPEIPVAEGEHALRTCDLRVEKNLDRIAVTCRTSVSGNGASRDVDECKGTLRRVGAAPGEPAPAP